MPAMKRLLPLLAIAVAMPAYANEPPSPIQLSAAEEAGRTLSITVFGEDPCPTADDGTIIVCARLPEKERFRIPKAMRVTEQVSSGPGWAAQVANIDGVSRQILPNSCSAVGSGGFTGCVAHMLSQWYAERRMSGSLTPLWRP
jgi:hypothetical protein